METILVIAFWLTRPCTSQSLPANSTTLAFVVGCGGCELAGATATPTSFSPLSGVSAVTPTASYILLNAYSIGSEYSSNGICVTTSGSWIEVSPPFSVLKPASIPVSVFLPTAASSYVDYLGFTLCNDGEGDVTASALTPLVVTPNTTLPSSLISSTSALLPSKTNPTGPAISTSNPHRLDKQARIGIGIAIPVAVTALLLLALLWWRRSRQIKKAKVLTAQDTTSGEINPYSQQKAELEAEEKKKHELEAEERRYELDGESRIHEIAEESGHGMPPPPCARQELRGEEHSRELEAL